MANMEDVTEISIMVQIEATDLFKDESINWKYCTENATFSHKEACEFILHIPPSLEDLNVRLGEMERYGCTTEFTKVIKQMFVLCARYVLFYV